MSRFWDAIQDDILANTGQKSSALNIIRHILWHPAIRVLFNYRVARAFAKRGKRWRFAGRLFWVSNCFKTGCYLSPYSKIEPGVILTHAVGIVIGEGVTIKKGARLFQHVTVGTKNWKEDQSFAVIESGAVLYAGSIIAGSYRVGENAKVGANAVVTKDVPDHITVVGVPATPLP